MVPTWPLYALGSLFHRFWGIERGDREGWGVEVWTWPSPGAPLAWKQEETAISRIDRRRPGKSRTQGHSEFPPLALLLVFLLAVPWPSCQSNTRLNKQQVTKPPRLCQPLLRAPMRPHLSTTILTWQHMILSVLFNYTNPAPIGPSETKGKPAKT